MDLPPPIVRLVGVYDADGSAIGELTYFLKARVGMAHCALCDITHGRFRERSAWRDCRSSLPVPFELFHRDDQPDAVREAAGGALPIVAAELDDGGVLVLLGPDELEGCAGSPERLLAAIDAAVARRPTKS